MPRGVSGSVPARSVGVDGIGGTEPNSELTEVMAPRADSEGSVPSGGSKGDIIQRECRRSSETSNFHHLQWGKSYE